jgi:hypothetical protein
MVPEIYRRKSSDLGLGCLVLAASLQFVCGWGTGYLPFRCSLYVAGWLPGSCRLCDKLCGWLVGWLPGSCRLCDKLCGWLVAWELSIM